MSTPDATNSTTPWLGCIADDITGATDLAINLVQGGMRVVQVMGIPTAEIRKHASNADAIVVALKTRSVLSQDAVDQSLAALASLRTIGAKRFYFKYCSTFDSTPRGNIGPVAEALMDALGVKQTIYCPAFPRAGRTVYRGHLFVGDRLLNESGLENHPLNPMNDADLVRVLGQQTLRPVGLLTAESYHSDASELNSELVKLAANGYSNIVTDACHDGDLMRLAKAITEYTLVTGGSGLARFLPPAYREAKLFIKNEASAQCPEIHGRSLVLAGSCSKATQRQVRLAAQRMPHKAIDISAVLEHPDEYIDSLYTWAEPIDESTPILISSTAPPDIVSAMQAQHGGEMLASAVESFFGKLASRFVADLGVRRLVVAGGETSGSVTDALGIQAIRIGPEICPGVPWTETLGGERPLAVTFKSGNFGSDDFFTKALEMLP